MKYTITGHALKDYSVPDFRPFLPEVISVKDEDDNYYLITKVKHELKMIRTSGNQLPKTDFEDSWEKGWLLVEKWGLNQISIPNLDKVLNERSMNLLTESMKTQDLEYRMGLIDAATQLRGIDSQQVIEKLQTNKTEGESLTDVYQRIKNQTS